MAIVRCALAIIQKRGSETTPPTQIAELTAQEDSFLKRHVAALRNSISKDGAVRARFRSDSELESQFKQLRDKATTEVDFLDTCSTLVLALADSMKTAPRAEDCVVAVVCSDEPGSGETHSTLLKLDAEIEGANLSPQPDGSIRLEVFEHLLPAPGKLQKGLSWPDPRTDSDLIFLDINRGAAARYFQNAFAVEASPRPVDAEKALTEAIQKLDPPQAAEAVRKATLKSGPADVIAAELKAEYPELDTSASELGGSGGYAGAIRQGKMSRSTYTYMSDAIELKVPIAELERVSVSADGSSYVTTIRTSHPLGPYSRSPRTSDS